MEQIVLIMDGLIRTSSLALKPEHLSWPVSRPWQRQLQQLWAQRDEMF
jgi:hypothetical protein